MNAERLLQLYDRVSDAPDAIPRLRRFVLNLAVRGKLVEQNPRDEPAFELLRRIEVARARLVKAGLVPQPKKSPPISTQDLPVQVPMTWEWLRLRDIGRLAGGMTPSKNRSDYWDGDVVWLSPKDIKSDEVADSELKITHKGLEETRLQLFPAASLFMVARSGILKRTFPVAINRAPAACNQDLKVLVPYVKGQERYLQLMFQGLTDFILDELVKTGTTVQSLKYSEFEEQPFPIPPLVEQHRIVAKVDELMALCDSLEAGREKREATRDRLTTASLSRLTAPDVDAVQFKAHADFAIKVLPELTTRPDQIKVLRQTILDLAVRGKLVEQDPNDEPANELLKKIKAAKEARVRSGAFPQVKPPVELTNPELEFSIPAGWLWVRLGDVIKVWNGFAFKSSDFRTEGIPVIRIGDLQNGGVMLANAKRVSSDVARSVDSNFWIPEGALLIAMSGATTGKTAINLYKEGLLLNQRVGRIESFGMSIRFVRVFFETIIARNLSIASGTAIPNLSTQQLNATAIPLPPLAEQQRIIAKVDELLALCDQLEQGLDLRRGAQSHLLEGLINGALHSLIMEAA